MIRHGPFVPVKQFSHSSGDSGGSVVVGVAVTGVVVVTVATVVFVVLVVVRGHGDDPDGHVDVPAVYGVHTLGPRSLTHGPDVAPKHLGQGSGRTVVVFGPGVVVTVDTPLLVMVDVAVDTLELVPVDVRDVLSL